MVLGRKTLKTPRYPGKRANEMPLGKVIKVSKDFENIRDFSGKAGEIE